MTNARRLTLALAAWAAFAANAVAEPLHETPAPDDNLRIYMFLDDPTATLSLDGGPPASGPGRSVMFARLSAGPHAWTVTLPDGARASAPFVLSADDMIESKGRRWWCIAAGRRNGQLALLQLEPARCTGAADAGPD